MFNIQLEDPSLKTKSFYLSLLVKFNGFCLKESHT